MNDQIINKRTCLPKIAGILNIISIIIITLFNAQAQSPQDIQLADQYLHNGEFDKAAVLFEKLFNKSPGNSVFYQSYLICLTELKRYDDAKKMIRKQMKKAPADLSLFVDMGGIFQKEGNEKAASQEYEDAISNITPNMPQVTRLANRFYAAGLGEYAVKVYERGRKVFNAGNSDLFLIDLARLYQKNGDPQNTVNTLLDIVQFNPGQKEYAEGQLQPLLENNDYARSLQAELYRRIQKQPDNPHFSDLLVWYFIQKKDFTSAFIQVKALDKRNKEDGNRVYQFAQSAMDEGNYDAALIAFRYIIKEKGKSSFLYLPARTSELSTEKTRITIQHQFTPDELKQLEANYQSYLDEFGKTPQTLPTMREFAEIETRLLHNPDRAISILQEAIAISTNDKKLNGYLKLDLGDAQLIHGEVWEAMLLYGQVDKSFHDAPIGEEARFKNARLSFYMGDFDWSQTQLDVLKSATTELVANDALALSVFITDNMGLDTTPEPMQIYARADLLIFQKRFGEAITALDSLTRKYPDHSLNDDVIFEKGRIYLTEHKYADAAAMFNKIDETYSTDLLGDDALFQLAELEQNYLNDKNKAMELYKQILTKYKGSIYTVEARKRFRELRGDEAN